MKNHYVSQFIIKKFSSAINIFDIHTGKIDESKRSHKVFYKDDIYDEEIEKLVNCNIESKVSNILNNKILVEGGVKLTRKELDILKRYMLICSVRTQSEEQFCKALKKYESKADKYINIHNEFSFLKKTKDLNLSDNELYLRTLKVFAQAEYIHDIISNPLATREMLAWAISFLESYIAFWDTPKDKEYILTDCGMCSEYEGFHILTGLIGGVSKESYILKQIYSGKREYANLLASCYVMPENYNIYNLSPTRCMVAINPFFSLYYGAQYTSNENDKLDEIFMFDVPDIWPAIIQNKTLFDIPERRYSHSNEPLSHFAYDDEFIYKPKVLTNEDLIYINTLMLSQTEDIIGFNDATKIIDSIYYYVWHDANFNSVKNSNQPENEVIDNLFDNIYKSPYGNLCNYCDSKGGINKTEFIFLFEKLVNNIYKDFNENPYICEYFLSMPEETAKCKALDFLGEGEKKLETFKRFLDRINEERKNAKYVI